MSGGIYLIHNDDELIELREQPYDSEDLLQMLIAKVNKLRALQQ